MTGSRTEDTEQEARSGRLEMPRYGAMALGRWFSTGLIRAPRGHWVTSGDIRGSHDCEREGAPGVQCAETRDAAQSPAGPGQLRRSPRRGRGSGHCPGRASVRSPPPLSREQPCCSQLSQAADFGAECPPARPPSCSTKSRRSVPSWQAPSRLPLAGTPVERPVAPCATRLVSVDRGLWRHPGHPRSCKDVGLGVEVAPHGSPAGARGLGSTPGARNLLGLIWGAGGHPSSALYQKSQGAWPFPHGDSKSVCSAGRKLVEDTPCPRGEGRWHTSS